MMHIVALFMFAIAPLLAVVEGERAARRSRNVLYPNDL